jgi:uncharacterized protein YkwD
MKKAAYKKLAAFVFIFAVVFSLMPDAFAETDSVSDFKAEVISLVNVEREKANVAPLQQMDVLFTMADVRAGESAVSFGHTRPNGTRCFTIFGEYGLTYKAAGENLASGYKKPEKVVSAWMNSSTHKANILDPEFSYIGIGYYEDTAGKIYCSQLFYTPTDAASSAPAAASPAAAEQSVPAAAAPAAVPAPAAQPAPTAAPQAAPVVKPKAHNTALKAQMKNAGLIV